LRSVRVELDERSYDVRIGAAGRATLGDAILGVLGRAPRQAFLIADANVHAHVAVVEQSLRDRGIAVSTISLVATEPEKSLHTLGIVLGAMAATRLERGDVVVGLGGGITGDVAGFAAACYRRGIAIVQCPTTLLAMVDASVGGKTGVNLEVGGTLQKNMVGAFHQPVLVVADTDTLSTLPDREFKAGLAECVKHGLLGGCIGDTDHLAWIVASLPKILARESESLANLIERSVAFKAGIVEGDERELAEDPNDGPSRALLNLGHTFAHAIETLPHLSPTGLAADAPLLHGEAVAIGLVGAAAASASMGLCAPELTAEVRLILGRCGLPTRVAGLPDLAALEALMGADKKVAGGRTRLILPTPGRNAKVVTNPPKSAIAAGWDAVRAG
jgi:3-dehydroquinate synthase